MNVTDEIKSRLDIVDVVSDTVQLRKAGKSFTGFCPFHQNTRTPSFVVFPDTQTWRCFGACADGGDLFSYVMKKQGWDFKEALEHLASRAGVPLEELSPAGQANRDTQQKLTDLLTASADYFHQLLRYAPEAEHAREYIANRALREDTQETFKIGYSLDSWDACRTHFNAQGYNDDDLVAAGLLSENLERGTRYDRFRGRLMIPIRDVSGRVIGFGARTLEKDGIPKYLNSPQTQLFDKSSTLFGLDLAKRHIREARQAVIVEGYMDVMQGWQMGFRNIIAQMGTALTESQLKLLKRYTKRFVIALDADAAGAKATMRSLEVARETLDREVDVRFDAPHLVRHEGRLQADIRIVTLPEGNDPDKIIRENPTLWPQLLADAQPVVAYVIGVLTKDLDLQDAKAKSDVVRQVIPLIQDMPDPIERDHYRQLLARTLRVDERTLQQVALQTRQKKTPKQASRQKTPPPQRPRPGRNNPILSGGKLNIRQREAYHLSHCLHHPHIIKQANQRLHHIHQPALSHDDFTSPEDHALWRELMRLRWEGEIVTIQELCDSLEGALLQRAQTFLNPPNMPQSSQERMADSLALSILSLRLEKLRRQLSEVQQLLRETHAQDDDQTRTFYLQQSSTLSLAFQRINKAQSAMSATGRRQAEDQRN